MKLNKYTAVVAGLFALITSASASITLATQYGQATDSAGGFVPDGTLWALMVSSDTTFAGGFGLDSSIKTASSTQQGLDLIKSTFLGQTLALGTVFSGDTVFALGGFNGEGVLGVPGSTADSLVLNLGVNGLVSGRNYAFYFFPGVSYTTGGATYTIGDQIGGVNTSLADAGAQTGGMVIPNDGFDVTQGASTPGDLAGSIPSSSFTAVVIPEPSAALLGAIGALGLLRRRRN